MSLILDLIRLMLIILSGLHSWRCLGDAIASAFALGYHEDVSSKSDTPTFLVRLRENALARLYTNDKSFAIFLGRPPRMSKRFMRIRIPPAEEELNSDLSILWSDASIYDWDQPTPISYQAELRWSALCALTHEEVLELLFAHDRSNHGLKIRWVLFSRPAR